MSNKIRPTAHFTLNGPEPPTSFWQEFRNVLPKLLLAVFLFGLFVACVIYIAAEDMKSSPATERKVADWHCDNDLWYHPGFAR
jgi:hypothetical protein